ncbi:MAG: DNA adenine methylase [Candidatus Acididesulfobacter guangdongensis]|uniref:Site-specific DNA-methyltransferase (adenine-specific) n=1 Tax=Acididesulfobacter guangdongensis TaxID=2597225 RepID=A0A519BE81_ACIG2|nr:MAG: DNA adenine methylase [Candidatus Acididesulfobacter guangdongensis]
MPILSLVESKTDANLTNPKPFIKWAGGKRQLIEELISLFPANYNRYFEPFIGGGALFFAIQPENAYISDINPELINLYNVVKNDVDSLIEDLRRYKNTEEEFYKIRNLDRKPSYKKFSKVRKASRFIYLNKTCYNGLYRTNSDGYFNVPFGFYKNPNIIDEKNLKVCSELLKKTEIALSPFSAIESKIKTGDFVYFDPPYMPISKTSSFTKYYKDDFDVDAQFELKELCDRLTKKRVYFMLSNSYSELILNLYKQYNIKKIRAIRAINCKAAKRGAIDELIITNY